jgi:hypothetical protein
MFSINDSLLSFFKEKLDCKFVRLIYLFFHGQQKTLHNNQDNIIYFKISKRKGKIKPRGICKYEIKTKDKQQEEVFH